MTDDTRFLIVTGAGRSGTSAVARVLHESGVTMGRDMAAASEVNPEGFYEDLDVVALNERILTDVGMNDPWRPERWPSRAMVRSAGAAYRGEMTALAQRAQGGWKDPRFAVTLEAWLQALPSQPEVIVCLRSPQAYADSATRIYGLVKPARARREWARHYRRLLAVLRRHKLEATCIEYDALIEQPRETIAALSRFAGRRLDPSYVVPRLRRQYAPVPETYRTLYREVLELADQRNTRGKIRRVARGKGETPASTMSPSGNLASTPEYDLVVNGLVVRIATARAQWESSIRMPLFELTDEARAACRTYNDVLTNAQLHVVAIMPPKGRVRAHEMLRRRVDIERMIAHLSFAAAQSGQRARAAAVRAWRRYGQAPWPAMDRSRSSQL